jgi:hypothetical protein
MSEEGQMIYLHKLQVFWHTKKGKNLIPNTKGTEEVPIQMVSRAKDLLSMNKSKEIINSLQKAVIGSKVVHNFRVIKIYESKPISRSFIHKEKDYDKEFR